MQFIYYMFHENQLNKRVGEGQDQAVVPKQTN